MSGKLKPGWKVLKFGDIAENIAKRVSPANAETDIYVGLEHLDTESLKLRQWGHPSDVSGEKFEFKKGDIIFGRRRAYQRKLAVAEFDGICSAHSMVLRAKPEMVYPDFFPFFLQSDMFMERAIEISVGSLSPTINWKTLRVQEFPLPPLDEQRRIAEILWAADKVTDKFRLSCEKLAELQDIEFSNLLHKGLYHNIDYSKNTNFGEIPKHWTIKPLSKVADVAYGISASVASNTNPRIGWPIITGANITLNGELDLSKTVYIEPPKKNDFILKKGDLLFNWRSGSPQHVGKTAIFNLDGDWTFASFILRIRPIYIMNREFLFQLLNFMRKRKLFSAATSQQVNFKMNATMLRDIAIVVPPKTEQDSIVRIVKAISRRQSLLSMHIKKHTLLFNNLTNKLLGV